jgi:hypothetical protein
VSALSFALIWGGTAVLGRFATLFEADPADVYVSSGRANMLTRSFFEILPEYPLGAGLCRWGMMRTYFGDEGNKESPPIWSEMQISAWLLDGGVPLMLLYVGALVVAARREFQVALKAPDRETRSLAAIVFAANAGTLLLIFGFTPFTTPVGIQYWFLAGALHGLTSRRAVESGAETAGPTAGAARRAEVFA